VPRDGASVRLGRPYWNLAFGSIIPGLLLPPPVGSRQGQRLPAAPPHGSPPAAFPHEAHILDVWRQSAARDKETIPNRRPSSLLMLTGLCSGRRFQPQAPCRLNLRTEWNSGFSAASPVARRFHFRVRCRFSTMIAMCGRYRLSLPTVLRRVFDDADFSVKCGKTPWPLDTSGDTKVASGCIREKILPNFSALFGRGFEQNVVESSAGARSLRAGLCCTNNGAIRNRIGSCRKNRAE